jgi:hypothetical protein
VQHSASPRGDEPERASIVVRIIRNLRCEMCCHPLDVLHQRNGVPEDLMINALKKIPRAGASVLEDRAVCIVDMAASVRCSSSEFTADGKRASRGCCVPSKPGSPRRHRWFLGGFCFLGRTDSSGPLSSGSLGWGVGHDLLTVHCHSVLGYLPFCMSAAMLSTTRGRSSR